MQAIYFSFEVALFSNFFINKNEIKIINRISGKDRSINKL